MNHFRIIFAWILLLCLTARAQDSVVPHVPTVDEIAAQIGDDTTIIYTNGVLTAPGGIIIQGDTNLPKAFLRKSSTNAGYQLEYGPSAVTQLVAFTEYFPGQLVWYTSGYTRIWMASTRIYAYATNYPGFNSGTNVVYPIPGLYNQWAPFTSDGAPGATGAQGTPGVNGSPGASNIRYSVWSATYGYDSNVPTVVSYDGQWYDLIAATSSNQQPTLNTSVWAVSVAKGTGGEIVGTNLVMRGSYDAGYTYTTNDGVSYLGSSFYIGPTNVALGAGNAPAATPSDGPMWTVLAGKGDQGNTGATGPAGADGNVLFITNQLFQTTNDIWSQVGANSNANMRGLVLVPGASLSQTSDINGVSYMTIPTNSPSSGGGGSGTGSMEFVRYYEVTNSGVTTIDIQALPQDSSLWVIDTQFQVVGTQVSGGALRRNNNDNPDNDANGVYLNGGAPTQVYRSDQRHLDIIVGSDNCAVSSNNWGRARLYLYNPTSTNVKYASYMEGAYFNASCDPWSLQWWGRQDPNAALPAATTSLIYFADIGATTNTFRIGSWVKIYKLVE